MGLAAGSSRPSPSRRAARTRRATSNNELGSASPGSSDSARPTAITEPNPKPETCAVTLRRSPWHPQSHEPLERGRVATKSCRSPPSNTRPNCASRQTTSSLRAACRSRPARRLSQENREARPTAPATPTTDYQTSPHISSLRWKASIPKASPDRARSHPCSAPPGARTCAHRHTPRTTPNQGPRRTAQNDRTQENHGGYDRFGTAGLPSRHSARRRRLSRPHLSLLLRKSRLIRETQTTWLRMQAWS